METNQMSAYDLMVKKNRDENEKLLKSLGLTNGLSYQNLTITKKTVFPKKTYVKLPKRQSVPDFHCQNRMSTRRSLAHQSSEQTDKSDLLERNAEENSPLRARSNLPPPTFGEIDGVAVGDWWPSRIDCSKSGVHRPTIAGIHGKQDAGCYSIALSGGYEDDVDCGESFTYTGSGGRDLKGTKAKPKNLRTAPQTKDQVLDGRNATLQFNMENKIPVRVIRGYKLDSPFAPELGYRYDGLYTVEKCWTALGLSGFKVYKFALKRMPNQDPPPWKSSAPLICSLEEEMDPPAEQQNTKPKTSKTPDKKKRVFAEIDSDLDTSIPPPMKKMCTPERRIKKEDNSNDCGDMYFSTAIANPVKQPPNTPKTIKTEHFYSSHQNTLYCTKDNHLAMDGQSKVENNGKVSICTPPVSIGGQNKKINTNNNSVVKQDDVLQNEKKCTSPTDVLNKDNDNISQKQKKLSVSNETATNKSENIIVHPKALRGNRIPFFSSCNSNPVKSSLEEQSPSKSPEILITKEIKTFKRRKSSSHVDKHSEFYLSNNLTPSMMDNLLQQRHDKIKSLDQKSRPYKNIKTRASSVRLRDLYDTTDGFFGWEDSVLDFCGYSNIEQIIAQNKHDQFISTIKI